MKKTFFIKSYSLCVRLIIASALIEALAILTNLFAKLFTNTSIGLFKEVGYQLVNMYILFTIIGMLVCIFSCLICFIEAIIRVKYDKIFNMASSVTETHIIHRFLKQDVTLTTVANVNQLVSNNDHKIKKFNRAIRKSVVDIREDNVTVYIPLPRSQQSQKILKDIDSQLKEQLASDLPDYYFSVATRFKNNLYFEGKRR